jgi:Zn-dependent peptidase ImmA (M78 family)
MSETIKAPFIDYPQTKGAADSQLRKLGLSEGLPVDIEGALDNILRMNIIPFPRLFADFNMHSLTLSNLRDIYVDQDLHGNLELPYRFTLAHEFGHIILHCDIYRNHHFSNLETYIDFINSIDERDYSILEYQANCFAGHFLVPTDHLKKHFKIQSAKIVDFILRRFKSARREDYIGIAVDLIAGKLSKIFQVHTTPIKIRLEKENLIEKIP